MASRILRSSPSLFCALNQMFRMVQGRIVPSHAPHLCLDVRRGKVAVGSKLIFSAVDKQKGKVPGFSLNEDGRLVCTSDGAESVVAGLKRSSDFRLELVPSDSDLALTWEWRSDFKVESDSARPSKKFLGSSLDGPQEELSALKASEKDIELGTMEGRVAKAVGMEQVDASVHASPKDSTSSFTILSRSIVLTLGIGFIAMALFSAFSILNFLGAPHVSGACNEPGRFSPEYAAGNNQSIVSRTLYEHCDCIPNWIAYDLYFDPLSTLYVAILVVLAFMCVNRLGPILGDAIQRIFIGENDELPITKTFKTFILIPSVMQVGVEAEMGDVYASLPRIILRRKLSPIEGQENAPRRGTVSPAFVEWFKDIDHNGIEKQIPSSEVIKALVSPTMASLRSLDGLLRKYYPNMPSVTDHDGEIIPEKGIHRLVSMHRNKTNHERLKLELDSLAPSEFIDWFHSQGKGAQRRFEHDFSFKVNKLRNSLKQASDHDDNLCFFILQLGTFIWVFGDYFFFQSWPSGKNWVCRWVYLTGAVMYKPLTLPMWFCLTVCSHYSFADRVGKRHSCELILCAHCSYVRNALYSSLYLWLCSYTVGLGETFPRELQSMPPSNGTD